MMLPTPPGGLFFVLFNQDNVRTEQCLSYENTATQVWHGCVSGPHRSSSGEAVRTVGLSLPGRRHHGPSYGDIVVVRLLRDYCLWPLPTFCYDRLSFTFGFIAMSLFHLVTS